ncbi:Retrovirus-related Pol polyprotein from type-2 retrotransposable element R2DM [Folsomia candida]|uniref:Retrovirus-related Pol polyprotein from type-2 retrotransposable element R2DM n=1 Tax=Folsomia candida TaxID=158441 RepID=A0A226D4W4_FOLCA|nr:Retrovirus-related Pol polyprotein from type-2 retrotransposable element R2DM [Folsomia candida]
MVKITNINIICTYLAPTKEGDENFNDICSNTDNEPTNNLVVIGDFNARTGEIPNRDPDDGESLKRSSSDKIQNSRGKKVMKYAHLPQLILLNGWFPTDVPAQFTFINKNDCSIPDLCFISHTLLSKLKQFTVLESVTSTHLPVQLDLHAVSQIPQGESLPIPPHKLPPKVTWNPAILDTFTSSLPEIDSSHDSYHNFQKTISQALRDANLINQRKLPPSSTKSRPTNPPWFCEMCSSLKQRTKSLLKSLRKAPSSDFEQAKDKYVQSRQEYSLQLKASKQKYKNDIIKAMLNHRNTTDFWATVNKMRTHLKSAYDSPGHADLWDVLSNAGMGSKIINVLISLYSRANGQVKLPSGLSDKFKIRKGVLQGEPQSGLNFNIFINDLVKELDEKGPPPIQVGDAKLHLLLFVDDIALLGDTPSQIQQKINIAARFFHRRSLQVNVDKTKVVIFAKKKSTKLLARSHFHWENQSLEIAPSYKYLGVTFSANGTFTTHTLESRVKIATAATKVWDICRKSGVPPIDTHLKLFNSLVKSTLLYDYQKLHLSHFLMFKRTVQMVRV